MKRSGIFTSMFVAAAALLPFSGVQAEAPAGYLSGAETVSIVESEMLADDITLDEFVRLSYAQRRRIIADKVNDLIEAYRADVYTYGDQIGQRKPDRVLQAHQARADFIENAILRDRSTEDHIGGIERLVYTVDAIHANHPNDDVNKVVDFFIGTEWNRYVQQQQLTSGGSAPGNPNLN